VTSARRRRYRDVLKVLGLGLEDRLGDRVGLLSGGQRQSLALLMATMNPPELLLLDEHTAALDPRTAEKVLVLTDARVREHRLTTLMVTHNMHQAIELGSRLLMLHEGRVQMDLRGEEKRGLTVADVIAKFGQSLKDESLLTAG
jgi:putative ABC transport system ATP-binding protein